jgi:hypothetical protein
VFDIKGNNRESKSFTFIVQPFVLFNCVSGKGLPCTPGCAESSVFAATDRTAFASGCMVVIPLSLAMSLLEVLAVSFWRKEPSALTHLRCQAVDHHRIKIVASFR